MEEDKPSSAAREIVDYTRQVNAGLRSLHRRTGYEPSTDVTPLSHLLAAEDDHLDEWAVKNETARAILSWIAADGPHPAQILRRIYLLGDHMMVAPYCLLNLREKAQMCGDSHGAQHWRMKRICVDPLIRKGAVSVKAPGQKGAKAAAAASAAQQGNHNRANGRGGGARDKRRPANGRASGMEPVVTPNGYTAYFKKPSGHVAAGHNHKPKKRRA